MKRNHHEQKRRRTDGRTDATYKANCVGEKEKNREERGEE